MRERVQIMTVVDVTNTHANRQSTAVDRGQQSNYNAMIQTAGLRVLPMPISCISKTGDVSNLGFGANITDKQRYWIFEFEHEYIGGIDQQSLIEDFDLVPVVTGLKETALINNNAFRTKDSVEKNIIFNFNDLEDINYTDNNNTI
tara:strand:- start:2300 stop:2734 length:435 start_codon:yes stop_codon:yes gene_type:complete